MSRLRRLILLHLALCMRRQRCTAEAAKAVTRRNVLMKARRLKVTGVFKHWVAIRLRRDACRSRRQRRGRARPVLQGHDTRGAWASLIPLMRESDPEAFYSFHRCSVEDFDYLLELVGPRIEKTSKGTASVCPGERLSVTLRYLASGDLLASLQFLYLLSAPCLSAIIRETTHAIWYSLKSVVFRPISTGFWQEKAAEFGSVWQCSQVVGAVDAKYYAFEAFSCTGSDKCSVKGSHSLNVIPVTDGKHKFISVDVYVHGQKLDSEVFRSSSFGRKLDEQRLQLPEPTRLHGHSEDLPFVFVGDGIFAPRTNLLVPFVGEVLPPEEQVFNHRLSRVGSIVDNALGVLSTRFRILRKTVFASTAQAKGVLLACCALHNFHLENEDALPAHLRRYIPPKYVDHYKGDGRLVRGRWRTEDKGLAESLFVRLNAETPPAPSDDEEPSDGSLVRESFMEYFVDNPVPWQWSPVISAQRRPSRQE